MAASTRSDIEVLIRAEVERSVAAYAAITPSWMLPKMREIAERYWREHPDAVRALQLMADKQQRLQSGERGIGDQPSGVEARAAARKE